MDLRWLHVLVAWSMAMSVFVFGIGFERGTASADGAADSENDIIQISLRWCVVDGSTTATNPASLGASTADEVLLRRMERATAQIWLPRAHIILRSAMNALAPAGATIPVIPDPVPPASGTSAPGDIDLSTGLAEVDLAKSECETAWDALSDSAGVRIRGPIAINVQHLLDPATPTGFSIRPLVYLSPTSSKICANPGDAVFAYDATLIVQDASLAGDLATDTRIVAHEFGHVLDLKDGIGSDGGCKSAPDALCTGFAEAPPGDPTIMDGSSSDSTDKLNRWQCANSRNIARVTWGSVVGESGGAGMPTCSVVPGTAIPGTPATISVANGAVNAAVAVDIDDSQVSTATLDESGAATIYLPIPSGSQPGIHLITVHVTARSLSAVCVVSV